MPIDSSVAELLTAQLFVLVQDAPDPIFFYINSTGIAVRLAYSQMHATHCKPSRAHRHACMGVFEALPLARTPTEKHDQVWQRA